MKTIVFTLVFAGSLVAQVAGSGSGPLGSPGPQAGMQSAGSITA